MDFTKPPFKQAKIIFPSVAFFYSLNIVVDAHLQCVNNQYTKFKKNETKTVGVTGYTN